MEAFRKIFDQRPLVLASKSPRRRALFELIGLTFLVDPADVDEDVPDGLPPVQVAEKIAQEKATATAKRHASAIVVGADTIVVLDEQVLGKPANADDAERMLRSLSGRTHDVYTGFAILGMPENRLVTAVECTKVHFRTLGEAEIREYVATGHPLDKAGAYGIQDQSAVFVDRIEGCFYNVMGFPLARFYQVCKAHFKGIEKS